MIDTAIALVLLSAAGIILLFVSENDHKKAELAKLRVRSAERLVYVSEQATKARPDFVDKYGIDQAFRPLYLDNSDLFKDENNEDE